MITKRIEKYEMEIERLKCEIVDFVNLKTDYEMGMRDIYEDYPNWNHPFHLTPMNWINWRIDSASHMLKSYQKKVKELYKKRDWLEVRYFHLVDEDEISEIINECGFVRGTKL